MVLASGSLGCSIPDLGCTSCFLLACCIGRLLLLQLHLLAGLWPPLQGCSVRSSQNCSPMPYTFVPFSYSFSRLPTSPATPTPHKIPSAQLNMKTRGICPLRRLWKVHLALLAHDRKERSLSLLGMTP